MCMIVITSMHSITLADMRSATGKPLLDFYTVYGAIDSVKILCELCNKRYPEYKKQNDKAYDDWRARNLNFIYKVEQYNDEIMTKATLKNGKSYEKQVLDNLRQYEQSTIEIHQMFLDYGEQVYRETCLSYPEYTKSEKADFPNYYKEHIQIFESYWHKK